MWNLPTTVNIDGKDYEIRNNCDYRVVLDVIRVIAAEDLTDNEKLQLSLFIFYKKPQRIENISAAASEMMKIINLGEIEQEKETSQPPIMDWEHDFPQLAPPVSRVLGYSVRDEHRYTHWYDFIGAYMEIGECTFATVISIRSKMRKGKKLDETEKEFYRSNKKIVDLPRKLTSGERDWLESDW